jgi:SAM-dependent methyltransferase
VYPNHIQSTYPKPIAQLWNIGMRLSGLQSGLRRFLRRLPIDLPPNARILDAGCGPGSMSFALLDRWPDARIVATDIDPIMLSHVAAKRRAKNVPATQLQCGLADINHPERVTFESGQVVLEPASFDLVIVGAALEHARLDRALPGLFGLIKPDGVFVNVGMKSDAIGALYGKAFRYDPITWETLSRELHNAGATNLVRIPLMLSEFPANVTRIAVTARKNGKHL